MEKFIVNLNEAGLSDTAEVGMKFALLGEVVNSVRDKNMPVADGYIITMTGYRYYLQYNNLLGPLKVLMDNLTDDNLEATGLKARQLLMAAKFPPKLESAFVEAYGNVFNGQLPTVAVRSSVEGDDIANEFAGYESHLNIKGSIALAYAIRCCFASVYSDRAIMHRNQQGLPHDIAIAVGIQQMVRSDIAGSGTIETNGLATRLAKTVNIQSIWGLGTNNNKIYIPDEHIINCENNGACSIIRKVLGDKSSMRVYNEPAAGINTTLSKITPSELRVKFVLDDTEALLLAQWALTIRSCFTNLTFLKWAKDGLSNKLYIIGVGVQPANINITC